MFSLWFAILDGSFVFLDMGPSNLFLAFSLFLGAEHYSSKFLLASGN
jgi:hypothetical protein